MTFVSTLRIYGIASRNFINTSMAITVSLYCWDVVPHYTYT